MNDGEQSHIIIQHAVNNDPVYYTVAVYVICEVVVQFVTQLDNILKVARNQYKINVDMAAGRRKRMHIQRQFTCVLSLRCSVFLKVYRCSVGYCCAFEFIILLSFVGLRYTVVLEEATAVCFAQIAWDMLWQESLPFLTTTAT